MVKLLLGQENMVLEWREREHEDMDRDAMGDTENLHALQRFVLLKLYCTLNMRAEVCLQEILVSLWDHELGLFDLQGETLELTVEYIYFITGLSHMIELVNMEGTGQGGDPLIVQYYINTYFLLKTPKSGT